MEILCSICGDMREFCLVVNEFKHFRRCQTMSSPMHDCTDCIFFDDLHNSVYLWIFDFNIIRGYIRLLSTTFLV